MREYDKKIAEGEAKARALTQQRELREMGRETTSSSAVDQGSESSFSSMSVSHQLTSTCSTNKLGLIKWF